MEKWVRKSKIYEFQQKGFGYVKDIDGDRVKRGKSFLMRKEELKPVKVNIEKPKPKKKAKK